MFKKKQRFLFILYKTFYMIFFSIALNKDKMYNSATEI